MERFRIGQRWLSDLEPELGLGAIAAIDGRQIEVLFPATGERRRYAAAAAPLRRALFQPGDRVRDSAGAALEVQEVLAEDGLVVYRGAERALREEELAGELALDAPEERLLSGAVDDQKRYALRRRALEARLRAAASPARGLTGGRIALLPHQLFIASEVARRPLPRVLLADEVGLGKTIEACLVVHRMLLTGRAQRVAILVPDSLVHQWLVELVRRFNLRVSLFDEERCTAIEESDPDANPFATEQTILANLAWLAADERRGAQAIAAGFDLVVVDEAHHLDWTPEAPSAGYRFVEQLATGERGLLLLTATPEQLGQDGHFARLRLLDPARHRDLAEHRREAERFRSIAELAERVLQGAELAPDELARLGVGAAGSRPRDELLAELIDRHGTGRVMFRNTRAAMQGSFPRRIVRVHSLDAPRGDAHAGFERRVSWLAALLREHRDEKFVLIVSSRAQVEAIDATLKRHAAIKTALFHDGLTLFQRDRAAAWFAEEDGARLLLCSEIGSEGRNFQFAHHLVLFDLPLDLELLEQRIGRLDRIGQKRDIEIHVPFVRGGGEEAALRWVHDGLAALERTVAGALDIGRRFGARVRALMARCDEAGLDAAAETDLGRLVEDSREACAEIAHRLERGRDRLLEMSSFRPERAAALIEAIAARDADAELEALLIALWEHYGVAVEDVAPRTYRLAPEDLYIDAFPGLPAAGAAVTFDRARALEREDLLFLTADHPMVTGALEMLLGSPLGNAAFALWPDARKPGLLLEASFVLEVVAPPGLGPERFLPPEPLRVVLDAKSNDVTGEVPAARLERALRPGAMGRFLERPDLLRQVVPGLIGRAREILGARVATTARAATAAMERALGRELERLIALRAVNPAVRAEEIDRQRAEIAALRAALAAPRLRLDAVRLILAGNA